jgi:hypothetical protein
VSGTSGLVDAADLLRTLLDPDRLAVLGCIARAPRTTAQVGAATGVAERDVLRTLGPLVQEGYVRRVGDPAGADPVAYVLDATRWRAVAQHLPQADAVHPRVGFGMTDEERDVLARFFTGERLQGLPAQRSKRLVVLERLALEFEPGERYVEPEVDDRLARFSEDHTSLRRALIDEGYLDREPARTEDGRSTVVYWRAGGRLHRR